MIEAAHLRPDAENGSSDARNGLPMNAALHRAFDAHLFAIHPDTLQVMVRPQGPSLVELGITEPQLILPKLPHKAALEWRYAKWLKANKMTATEAVPPAAAMA
ncbi:HNH endonuclease [Kitasatospora aburaviensis]